MLTTCGISKNLFIGLKFIQVNSTCFNMATGGLKVAGARLGGPSLCCRAALPWGTFAASCAVDSPLGRGDSRRTWGVPSWSGHFSLLGPRTGR